VEECGPCPFFASFTLAFAFTTEEKAQKNLSHGKKNLSQVKKNLGQSTPHMLPKHTHYKCWELPDIRERERERERESANKQENEDCKNLLDFSHLYTCQTINYRTSELTFDGKEF
jgi:hypothetical protein